MNLLTCPIALFGEVVNLEILSAMVDVSEVRPAAVLSEAPVWANSVSFPIRCRSSCSALYPPAGDQSAAIRQIPSKASATV